MLLREQCTTCTIDHVIDLSNQFVLARERDRESRMHIHQSKNLSIREIILP